MREKRFRKAAQEAPFEYFWQSTICETFPWRANVSQCRKTERGDPLRFFNIHSVAKHEKIEEKNFFLFSG